MATVLTAVLVGAALNVAPVASAAPASGTGQYTHQELSWGTCAFEKQQGLPPTECAR